MGRFRPASNISTSDGSNWKQYSTYKQLKRDLSNRLEESLDGKVFVCRYRRGQWGEWTEWWQKINGKLQITKEGWS